MSVPSDGHPSGKKSLAVCQCKKQNHDFKRIVLTGGPGAGKTAILEMVRKKFCEHVSVLPEAAGIVFGGGFWRHKTVAGRKAAQRAIFYVQRESEKLVEEEKKSVIALCDRGTVDGLAYWPVDEMLYWEELGTTKDKEFSRYAAVIHLRTPTSYHGYNNDNPLRTESEYQAADIDERLVRAWEGHPKRFFVESSEDFLEKVAQATALIENEIPDCCKI